MNLHDVLIKPVLTEKANAQQEKLGKYTFKVSARANKLEIKKAVEEFYGISVSDVHTVVVPAKSKSRFTKAGYIQGRKPSYKKAVVTLAKGDTIDLYANI
ncbi:MAG: 50S ribosomal protein L23 [Bacteroidetes bacterium]|nr:50S ribosomal protein L23 [Bacteroidota bacterium]